jgi:hypothetical protein
MSIIIKKATYLDHGRILELILKWFDEVTTEDIPKACNYTGVWLADLIARHAVIIAEWGGNIVGAIGLKFTNFPWNNEVTILSDDFLMTDKESRHLGVADKLIKGAKGLANELKLPLMLGHFSGTQAELKDKYLSKIHGFKYLGGHFIYKGE